MFVFSISLVSLNAQTTVNQTTDKKTCVKTAKCDKTTKTCNGIPCPPKCCKAKGTSTSMADADNTNVSPSDEAKAIKVVNKIEEAPERASNTKADTPKKNCSKSCIKSCSKKATSTSKAGM